MHKVTTCPAWLSYGLYLLVFYFQKCPKLGAIVTPNNMEPGISQGV